jgi:hypothetical protein
VSKFFQSIGAPLSEAKRLMIAEVQLSTAKVGKIAEKIEKMTINS